MGKWSDYTTKTALKDNDELMILDKDANANKRTLMDKIWNYVVDKMTTAVIAKLGTTDKTLIGAVNELNSKKICVQQIYGSAIYKDCNDLPAGESATAFSTAKNRPSGDNTWYIFCMSADDIKTQIAISVNHPSTVLRRTYNGTWGDWE